MLSALQAAVRGEAPVQIRETGLERREEAAPRREAATNIGSAGETAGLRRHLAQVLLILDLVVVVVVVRDLEEGRLVGVVVITWGWRGGFMEGGR